MPEKGLGENKYIRFLKQFHKTLHDYFGPKYKKTVHILVFLVCIVMICGFSWWNWDKIQHLPGVNKIVSWINEEPLPQADPNYFAVLIARLENDREGEIENLIIESLKEMKGIQILKLDRDISVSGIYPGKTEQEGHKQARLYLQKTNAQILIWGTVIKASGKSLPKLYWTVAENLKQKKIYERYQLTEDLSLPAIFWEDLADVIRLLVTTKESQFYAAQGKYIGDEIKPFIEKLRRVLKSHKEKPGWPDREFAQVLSIFAESLSIYGQESGKNEPLEEGISAFREALKEYTRERVPLEWAMTQSSLGAALASLGERESGTKRLEEAVAAFREALKEYTRERFPLEWAMAQNNLGTALRSLGERESGTKHLEEAVAACREALKEYTRERVPLYWAMAQNNLSTALARLGEREGGTKRLEEAVAACREALKEYARERVPLNWAMAQNSLGNALRSLGEREGGTKRLEEAVAAFREALKEYTRERVPFSWAITQKNLEITLGMIRKRRQ